MKYTPVIGALLAIPFITGFFGGGDNPMIRMETSKGSITIELFKKEAPKTVENFLAYVDSGHFDGTIFHRVIPGFVIQGGGYSETFEEKDTQAPIKNEATNQLSNKRGTLSMARTSDVDSATSQFFVNLVDNTMLDHRDESRAGYGYCVFGKVVESDLDVIDAIAGVDTHTQGYHQDVPVEPVIIESVTRIDD